MEQRNCEPLPVFLVKLGTKFRLSIWAHLIGFPIFALD